MLYLASVDSLPIQGIVISFSRAGDRRIPTEETYDSDAWGAKQHSDYTEQTAPDKDACDYPEWFEADRLAKILGQNPAVELNKDKQQDPERFQRVIEKRNHYRRNSADYRSKYGIMFVIPTKRLNNSAYRTFRRMRPINRVCQL